MTGEVAFGVVASVFGGALVAVTTSLMTRKKVDAETDMLRAQAERERAEATRILAGLGLRNMERSDVATTTPQPVGWFLAGADPNGYEIGVDCEIRQSGTGSGFIRARSAPAGFGTLMQICDASPYRGKRIRMCGVVRTQGVFNNRRSAQLWFRADGPEDKTVAFDNMDDRPIRGNQDWMKHCLVLDIPEDAISLAFGVMSFQVGTVWLDNVTLEEVDGQVAITGGSKIFSGAENLDFSLTE